MIEVLLCVKSGCSTRIASRRRRLCMRHSSYLAQCLQPQRARQHSAESRASAQSYKVSGYRGFSLCSRGFCFEAVDPSSGTECARHTGIQRSAIDQARLELSNAALNFAAAVSRLASLDKSAGQTPDGPAAVSRCVA